MPSNEDQGDLPGAREPLRAGAPRAQPRTIELGSFVPASDELVLVALERAERHRASVGEGWG
jgi:hypothetical protein